MNVRRVVTLAIAAAAMVAATPALARNRSVMRSCGQITFTVPHTGRQRLTYTEGIDARRLSCRQARAFVRAYERLGDEGKLPDRAGGKTRRSVIVFYQWTRPYRVNGFVCRSMALPNVLVNAGRESCGGPAGLVDWHETAHSG